MEGYGRVIAEEAKQQRQGINFDEQHAAAEMKWFVNRTWLKELHNLRSKLIHGDNLFSRTWGWGHTANEDEEEDGPTPWDRILFDSRLDVTLGARF